MAKVNDPRPHRNMVFLSVLFVFFAFGVADATVYRLPAAADAHISSQYPSTNDGYSIYLWAGYDPSNGILRSLMKFDISVIPALEADYVTSASLKIYVSGSSTRSFCLRTNSSDWSEGTVTWNNQPDVSWMPRVGITFPTSSSYQEITFNLNFLKNWIRGAEPNYGLQIRSETENVQGVVDMRSRHSSWPETLIVVTNPPPTHKLTISSINPNSGIPITVGTPDVYGNTNGTTTFDRYYSEGTVVYLTAPAKFGNNNFKEWRRDGVYYQGGQSVDLLMGSDHTMTAVYETPVLYTMTVNSCPENGIPIWVDGVPTYTPFTKQIPSGASVQLSAPNPALGRAFLAWWKDCQVYSIQQTVNLTVNANVTMTAEYTKNVPSSVTATGECDSIRVNWSIVGGASGYCVYKDGNQSPISCPSGPPFIDHVSDYSQHCYQVTATYSCCGNPSDKSPSQCASAVSTPGTPGTPSASPNPVCTNVQYCINWNAVAGANGYDIQEDGGSWTDVGNITSKCYSKSSPGNYSYAVRAKNSDCGPGNPSAGVTVTVQPCYNISGKVFRETVGVVVPDYPVQLFVTTTWARKDSVATDTYGIYRIEHIPSGDYDILGGDSIVYQHVIIDHDTTGLNIRLSGPDRIPLGVNETQNEPVVRDFSLNQNRPNPFNPTTEISFSLPRAADVILEVYNITGQRITTLFSGRLEAGNHTVVWNGKDETGRTVSSGIYLYRVKAGEYVESKKMVLLK